jgi:hypothetical protein
MLRPGQAGAQQAAPQLGSGVAWPGTACRDYEGQGWRSEDRRYKFRDKFKNEFESKFNGAYRFKILFLRAREGWAGVALQGAGGAVVCTFGVGAVVVGEGLVVFAGPNFGN